MLSREHLLSVAPLTDLFLYDLKIMDDAKHRHYTSVSNIPILENLTALGKIHNNIWLRMPIIPGINDDDENLEAVADLPHPSRLCGRSICCLIIKRGLSNSNDCDKHIAWKMSLTLHRKIWKRPDKNLCRSDLLPRWEVTKKA